MFPIVAFFAFLPFFFFDKEESEKKDEEILSMWNIDGMEGGKGSRTAFLKKIAAEYREKYNVIVMIQSVSEEGFFDSLNKGIKPDLLSFSSNMTYNGFKRLRGYEFPGGEADGKCYAYPWACGKYILFSLTDDYADLNNSRIVVSQGGNNVPIANCLFYEVNHNIEMIESIRAYSDFLSGKYKYLLGTQRDYFRFLTRGVNVYGKILDTYNDLYQYVSIVDGKNYEQSLKFADYLLSESVQARLSDIGLFSLNDDTDTFGKNFSVWGERKYCLSVFSDREKVCQAALSDLELREIKNLKNYLKTVA